MAIKNTLLGGTDWIDGEVLYAADLNDTNDAIIENPLKAIKLNSFAILGNWKSYSFILPYSATAWAREDYNTTDAGATATASNSTEEYGWLCLGDTTKGFSSNSSGATIRYTTDSGANWTTGTTRPPNSTTITGGDYSLDGLIYLSGSGGPCGLWYSTNDGVDFTQVGTPSGNEEFVGVGMHDATHGIAIEAGDGSIWYTTDGTTWTDSGHDWTIDNGLNRSSIYCYASGANLTDFKCLILMRKSDNSDEAGGIGNVGYYDGTKDVNSAAEIYHAGGACPYGTTTNFCLLDNGALCFVYASAQQAASPGNNMSATLVVCSNPTASVITGGNLTTAPTFYQIPLGLVGRTETYSYNLCLQVSDVMNQYDTNKVLIYLNCRKLFQIDLNGLD